MTAADGPPFPAMLEENLASASPCMLRAMLALFAGRLMGTEADMLSGVDFVPGGAWICTPPPFRRPRPLILCWPGRQCG